MYYHNITSDDMLNGDGLRTVLWVSGCEHACKNCHNPSTWCPTSGIPFTEWDEAEFFAKLAQDHIDGCTFSGGDPLHPNNRIEIGELAKKIKRLYSNKDIWLYTGYTAVFDAEINSFIFYDDTIGLAPISVDWIDAVDILVDGRFKQEVRDKDIHDGLKVHWRGSSNQRIIDVKQTFAQKQIVERSC